MDSHSGKKINLSLYIVSNLQGLATQLLSEH